MITMPMLARWRYQHSKLIQKLERCKIKNGLTNELKVWPMPKQVGSFAFRESGGIIAGTNSGFCAIDLDNDGFEKIVDPEPDRPNNRFNDGKTDRRGRYWCGSMDARLKEKAAYIYRLNPNFAFRKMAEGFAFICSNGIAFDPDDRRMYFGDTQGGMVYVFDFDTDEGRISNQRAFFSTADRRPGMVDGATVDSDGYYWFALVRGGKILRLDPNGRLDREFDMPVPSPTCVTFSAHIAFIKQWLLMLFSVVRQPDPSRWNGTSPSIAFLYWIFQSIAAPGNVSGRFDLLRVLYRYRIRY